MATPTIPERARTTRTRSTALLPVTNDHVNRPEPVLASPRGVFLKMGSVMRNRSQAGTTSSAMAESSGERTPTYAERMETGGRLPSSSSHVSMKSLLEQLPFCGKKEKSLEQIRQQIWSAERKKDYEELHYENVDMFPEGYPRASAWLASDNSYQNFRSYRTLSTRLLMGKQNNLEEIEKELFALDKQYEVDEIMSSRLRGWDKAAESDDSQSNLMERAKKAYLEYGELLDTAAKIHRLDPTTERDYRSMFNYFWHERPLAKASGSASFLTHYGDFVSLVPQARKERWFEDYIVDKILKDGPPSFWKRLLQTPRERARTEIGHVNYYDPYRLAVAARVLSILLITTLLLVPVFLLFLVPMTRGMMAFVASLFVLLFVVVISIVTDAKVQEILFGGAAYGAVLLIFLGNVDSNNSSCPAGVMILGMCRSGM